MAENKKFYLVYREDDFDCNGCDFNVFIFEEFETARKTYQRIINDYIAGWLSEKVGDDLEPLTNDVVITRDDYSIKVVDTYNNHYFKVWMDDAPREVITENTSGKSSLW
jgi:hypothetical protein